MHKLASTFAFFGAIAAVSVKNVLDDTGKTSHWHNFDMVKNGWQELAVCFMCLAADWFVISYHYMHPPHPKFLLVPKRRFSIRVHVISGSVEILCCVAAFFARSEHAPSWARVAAVGALFHSASAAFQTPIVFGVKSLMLPAYSVVIMWHVWAATHLIADPSSLHYLLQTYHVLHIYAWVRVCTVVLRIMAVLRSHEYTIATLMAGLLQGPFIFGRITNFYVVGSFVVFQCVILPLLQRFKMVAWDVTMEAERERFTVDESKERAAVAAYAAAKGLKGLKTVGAKDDMDKARTLFAYYDKNGDGALSKKECTQVAKDLGIKIKDLDRSFKRWDADGNGQLSFEEFYRYVYNYLTPERHLSHPHVRQQARVLKQKKSLQEKDLCKLVFDALDVDNSGTLEIRELESLLVRWGLPASEVNAYLASFDTDGSGTIEFEEFFQHFAPMWHYAFVLMEDKHARVNTLSAEPK